MGPYSRQEPALIPESMDQGKRALFQFFQSLFQALLSFSMVQRCLLRVASFFPPDGSLTHLAPAAAAFFGQRKRLSRGQRENKRLEYPG